ncbi:MAG TPA: hypothetical protein VF221_06960, partial [Chloroflexota bacterium]
MRAQAVRGVLGAGLLAVFMAWPAGVTHVFAATPQGNTGSGTIIPVPSASSTTTTPNACSGALNSCTQDMLKIINADRAQNGLAPLTLKTSQSTGKGSCVGSYGHSIAMAQSGAIWHINPKYPRASFPHSICVRFMHAGENVGESASGNFQDDLHQLDSMMMSEPHGRTACASTVNHACNILNPAFHQVGIG